MAARRPAPPPSGWRRNSASSGAWASASISWSCWDIVRYARRRGTPVAGRGSGASSLVAYLLGITNVCPLALRAFPSSGSSTSSASDFPDLDVDFCWRIRDDVIDYAFGRWGGRAAMVCTHKPSSDRSALRETAKALGLSDEQISAGLLDEDDGGRRPSDRLPAGPHRPDCRAGRPAGRPAARPLGPSRRHRHRAPSPSTTTRPSSRRRRASAITQYDKDGVEDIGLVKLDLLGNRNLSTVRDACDLDLPRRRGAACGHGGRSAGRPRHDPRCSRRPTRSAATSSNRRPCGTCCG